MPRPRLDSKHWTYILQDLGRIDAQTSSRWRHGTGSPSLAKIATLLQPGEGILVTCEEIRAVQVDATMVPLTIVETET